MQPLQTAFEYMFVVTGVIILILLLSFTFLSTASSVTTEINLLSGKNIPQSTRNNPPVLALTSPTDGSQFYVPADVVVSWMATDLDGDSLQLQVKCSDSDPPHPVSGNSYICSYQNAGTYHITVEASDGKTIVTDSVYIDVVRLPPATPSFKSVSSCLTFASPEENRYDGILFYGEHNRACIEVNVSGSFTVGGDINVFGDCIVGKSLHITSPGIYRIETDTTNTAKDCNIIVEFKHGNSISFDSTVVSVWHYLECNGITACKDKLSYAKSNFVSDDVNTVVILRSDITGTLTVPSGEYNSHIIFDGNGHIIENSGTAFYLKNVKNLVLYNTVIDGLNGSKAFKLEYSTVELRNSVMRSGELPLFLYSSGIKRSHSTYCSINGEGDLYPVYTYDKFVTKDLSGERICYMGITVSRGYYTFKNAVIGASKTGKLLSNVAVHVSFREDASGGVTLENMEIHGVSPVRYIHRASPSNITAQRLTIRGSSIIAHGGTAVTSDGYGVSGTLIIEDSNIVGKCGIDSDSTSTQLKRSTIFSSEKGICLRGSIYPYPQKIINSASITGSKIYSEDVCIVANNTVISVSDSNLYTDNRAVSFDGAVLTDADVSYCFLHDENYSIGYPLLVVNGSGKKVVDLNGGRFCHVSIYGDDTMRAIVKNGTIGMSESGSVMTDSAVVSMYRYIYVSPKVTLRDINIYAGWGGIIAVRNDQYLIQQSMYLDGVRIITDYTAIQASMYNITVRNSYIQTNGFASTTISLFATKYFDVDLSEGNVYLSKYSPASHILYCYNWGAFKTKVRCINCVGNNVLITDLGRFNGDVDVSKCKPGKGGYAC